MSVVIQCSLASIIRFALSQDNTPTPVGAQRAHTHTHTRINTLSISPIHRVDYVRFPHQLANTMQILNISAIILIQRCRAYASRVDGRAI